MGTIFKQIWNWFDGKKRIIGIVLVFVAQTPHLVEWLGTEPIDVLLYIGNGLQTAGAVLSVLGVVDAVRQKKS